MNNSANPTNSANTATDFSKIPVIDLGPLRDGSDPLGVAKQLHKVSKEVGFLYASNHGIDEETLVQLREIGLSFFNAPNEQKQSISVSGSHRGYLAQGGAKMQDDAAADLKQSFIWGTEIDSGNQNAMADHHLLGRNKWPNFVPELQPSCQAWFSSAHELAYLLMRAFALGLNLPEDTFLQNITTPLSRASLVYYPPQDVTQQTDQFGVGPHTDFGVLTILAQDDVGGLEVQTYNGDWVAAPPIPGTILINVGDLLARWTNDHYRSTPHRVINSSGRERLSIVLAYDPDYETMIDANQIIPNETARSEPISCGDYLTWRFKKAFSYRK